MKKCFPIFCCAILLAMCCSCDKLKDDPGTLSGDVSPMSAQGVTVASTSVEIAGVSNFSAVVTSLQNGVSTYSGQATVTNQFLKNLLSNIPELKINGDQVSSDSIKFKQTTEGIEFLSGPSAGIWVKYGSAVGDTYPIGSTGKVRTVVEKTGQDDYPYGFFLIKVVKVEENPSYLKAGGITKITYIANHKYGLVGVVFTFDDGTTANYPIYMSTQNG
jgi:hypothetical protein